MGEQLQPAPKALTPSKRPAPTPKYKRLTHEQQIAILKLHKLGKTQTEIGQVLGCDQRTVGRWLEACEDSTGEATAFFRGQALPMAQKIAKKGRPSDLIKALQGVGVLQEERSAGLVVQIGVRDSDVSISLSGGETLPATLGTIRPSPPLAVDMHRLTADTDGANVNITSLIPTSNEAAG